MTINEKLFNIQQGLVAPKDQYNSFGKYKYRSCESVLEALKPLLKANKCTVVFADDVKEIGGRVYVSTELKLNDIESDAYITVTAIAREEETKKGMDGSQVTGASSSYARKYALNALFAIDDNKDSDATNNGQDEKPLFKCAKCHKVLTPYISPKTGKQVSLREHEEASVKKFGVLLCRDCIAEASK